MPNRIADPVLYAPKDPLVGTEYLHINDASTDRTTLVSTVVKFFHAALGVFSKNQSVAAVALSIGSGAVAIDCSLSNNFKLSLTANVTAFTVTNATEGMTLNLCFDQDATGGRTWALPSSFHAVGTAPTFATTANAKNFISAYYDGTIWRYAGGAVA